MKNKALNKVYDFIIVGGGLAGLSCAYWLKKRHGKVSILILNDAKILNSSPCSKISDLTVGSFAYMYDLYREHGIEKVVELFKTFEENLNLIDEELEVLNRNPYINAYPGGTVNHFESTSNKENGFFQSFVHQLEKSNVDLEKVNNDNLKLGVKFNHDGNYEADKMMKTLYGKLFSTIDIVEDETCKIIGKQMSNILIGTAKGTRYLSKSVIITAGSSLAKFVPETKEKITVKKSYVMKVESLKNHLELLNYSSTSDRDYFVKLTDGYFYAHHEDVNTDECTMSEKKIMDKFENFKTKVFPGAESGEVDETQITFSNDGSPIKGRSVRNNSLYYLGGFSGQSKLCAFKAAKELVEMIKA